MSFHDGIDDDLIDAIYGAAAEPDLWGDVLDLLRERFRSAAASFSLQGYRDDSIQIGAHRGYGGTALADYASHFSAFNPFLTSSSVFAKGATMHDGVYDGGKGKAERFDNSAFYVDWAKPQGFRHAMGSALSMEGAKLLIFNYWRAPGEGGFSDEELVRQAGIAVHLARAAKLGETVARLRQRVSILEAQRSGDATGIVTLDHRGHVREVDAAAAALIGARLGLGMAGSRLVALAWREDAQLRTAIDIARTASATATSEIGPLLIGYDNGVPRLSLIFVPMPRQISPFPGDRDVAVLVLVKPCMAPRAPSAGGLRSIALRFGLSRSEERILGARMETRNLKEAAEHCGMTYSTARSHLKAAFEKTATSSQVALFRLIEQAQA